MEIIIYLKHRKGKNLSGHVIDDFSEIDLDEKNYKFDTVSISFECCICNARILF